MSDWNELSSIAGKWKFCRIYWQWILIEQTFLYTAVYRTFLYNPTNLKVSKKAPCTVNGLFRSRKKWGGCRWFLWVTILTSVTPIAQVLNIWNIALVRSSETAFKGLYRQDISPIGIRYPWTNIHGFIGQYLRATRVVELPCEMSDSGSVLQWLVCVSCLTE